MTTSDIEGSVSILKRIALLYNGDVTIESEEGKGITFALTAKSCEDAAEAENT